MNNIERALAGWHHFLSTKHPDDLRQILSDDVTFYSPIVFTPQVGKEQTLAYLLAASVTFPGDGVDESTSSPSFHYTKQVVGKDSAVLEFETTMGGTYVNGVDIITANTDGRICEFRVMIRPLQAVHAVHEKMRQALERAERG